MRALGLRHVGKDGRRVMVVHGRNLEARNAMFAFLRSLGLSPIEWEQAVRATDLGSPHNLEAVNAAMRSAQAVVVVMTAEDRAGLLPELTDAEDDDIRLRGQPRQNVIIEAGLALATDPRRVILVELGRIRHASDFDGLNTIRLNNSPPSRAAPRSRLMTAGCKLDSTAQDYLDPSVSGDFVSCLVRWSARSLDDDAGSPASSDFRLSTSSRTGETSDELGARALTALADFDRSVTYALQHVYMTGNPRSVVHEPSIRDELRDIADSLQAIQGFLSLLDISLPASCSFALGINYYITENYSRALGWFRRASETDDAAVATLAAYWASDLEISLGDFDAAVDSLRSAVTRGAGSRFHWQLRRRELEALFFRTAPIAFEERRPALIADIDISLAKLSEELQGSSDFQNERESALFSQGNLLLWAARLSPLDVTSDVGDDRVACLVSARHRFLATSDSLWSTFSVEQIDRALAQLRSDAPMGSRPDVSDDLIEGARQRFFHYTEPRSAVVLQGLMFVVKVWNARSFEDFDAAYRELVGMLVGMDPRTYLFSLFQRCMVPSDMFALEMETLMVSRRNDLAGA